jgi:hypothetical protein
MLRSDLQDQAKDGYVHAWLDPALVEKGIKLPDSWKSEN